MSWGHLARRFWGSLRPGGPGIAAEAWATRWLTPAEIEIWARMGAPDRRHAVGVARRVAESCGNPEGAGVSRPLLVAALMHDSGKVASGLGTYSRVAATLLGMALGRQTMLQWADRPSGWLRRAGLYVDHDRIGSRLLSEAGSHALPVAWAAEHHLPVGRWTVDPSLGRLMKTADDD